VVWDPQNGQKITAEWRVNYVMLYIATNKYGVKSENFVKKILLL